MASRARVAAAACLLASGLIVTGAGTAIALADPERGHGSSDDRHENGSFGDTVGDAVRRALGVESPNGSGSESAPGDRPRSSVGSGREDGEPGENESPDPTKTEQSPTDTTKPTKTTEPPETTEPTKTTEPPATTEPTETTTKPTETTPSTTRTTSPTSTTPTTTETSGTVGQPPPGGGTSSGGGNGAVVQIPRFHRPQAPGMQLPEELQPGAPGGPAVLDAGADAAPAGAAPAEVITLPVIVAPPIGVGAGAGGAGSPAGVASGPPPAAPRSLTQPPAAREPAPAGVGSNAVPASSYRVGYSEYLRTAGLPQVAALAVPGIAGILVLTGAGGLVGYRQAKAGLAVRAGGTARFMR